MLFKITLLSAMAFVAPAQAADWAVQTDKSHLGFSGVQTGAPFKGSFGTWRAEISFDPAHPEAGHAKVTIDLASARTGDTQRDTALPQADWFDVKHFPQATFEAAGFTPKSGDAYEAAGKLTIRGVAKDVVLPFTLAVAGEEPHRCRSAGRGGREPDRNLAAGAGDGDLLRPRHVAQDELRRRPALAIGSDLRRSDLSASGGDLEPERQSLDRISVLIITFYLERNGQGTADEAGLPIARDDFQAGEPWRFGAAAQSECRDGARDESEKGAGARGGHRGMT